MTGKQQRFIAQLTRRKKTFAVLSALGVCAALLIAAHAAWCVDSDSLALRGAIVILVLLNARQNLRQYKVSAVLEELIGFG